MRVRSSFVSNSSSSSFVVEAVSDVGSRILHVLPDLKKIENSAEKKRIVFTSFKHHLKVLGYAAENFYTERNGDRYVSLRDYCVQLYKCIPQHDIGVEEDVLKVKSLVDSIMKFDFEKKESYSKLIDDIKKLEEHFSASCEDDYTPRIVYSGKYSISDSICKFLKDFESLGHIKILEKETN